MFPRLNQPQRCFARSRNRHRAGFTIVELSIGVAILGIVASSVLFGLNQLNQFATVNRLYTAAQTLAQNQIDIILTMGPYDPATGKYPVPADCGDGTATNTILRTDAPYYFDPGAPVGTCPMGLAEKKVTIYRDPMDPTNRTIVSGTIKTTVKDTGMTVNVNGGPASLDLRQASVEVKYTFRNKTYSVVMETMRTADQ